jgi:hypothetical protein
MFRDRVPWVQGDHLGIMDIARSDYYGGVRETGRQQPQKKIMSEGIDRERRFESVTCPMPGVSELRSGIHDEDVDLCAVQLLRERSNERPNIQKTRQWSLITSSLLVVTRT